MLKSLLKHFVSSLTPARLSSPCVHVLIKRSGSFEAAGESEVSQLGTVCGWFMSLAWLRSRRRSRIKRITHIERAMY